MQTGITTTSTHLAIHKETTPQSDNLEQFKTMQIMRSVLYSTSSDILKEVSTKHTNFDDILNSPKHCTLKLLETIPMYFNISVYLLQTNGHTYESNDQTLLSQQSTGTQFHRSTITLVAQYTPTFQVPSSSFWHSYIKLDNNVTHNSLEP